MHHAGSFHPRHQAAEAAAGQVVQGGKRGAVIEPRLGLLVLEAVSSVGEDDLQRAQLEIVATDRSVVPVPANHECIPKVPVVHPDDP